MLHAQLCDFIRILFQKAIDGQLVIDHDIYLALVLCRIIFINYTSLLLCNKLLCHGNAIVRVIYRNASIIQLRVVSLH